MFLDWLRDKDLTELSLKTTHNFLAVILAFYNLFLAALVPFSFCLLICFLSRYEGEISSSFCGFIRYRWNLPKKKKFKVNSVLADIKGSDDKRN